MITKKTYIPAKPRNKKLINSGGGSYSAAASNNNTTGGGLTSEQIEILSFWKKDPDNPNTIFTEMNAYSQQGVSAYGQGVDGGGSVDLSKLLSWAGYTSVMADYYAPASLLVPFYNDMQSRVGAIESIDYAELDSSGKVLSSQLPSYVDDVMEFSSFSALPVTGESGKIYITIDTNRQYRWTGTTYAEISSSLALGETSSTAYRGDRGKIAYDHTSLTSNPHGVTASQIGASAILTEIKTVDGAGSGLDADLLDGLQSDVFARNSLSVNGLSMNSIKDPAFYNGYDMTDSASTGISNFIVLNYSPDWGTQLQFSPADKRSYVRFWAGVGGAMESWRSFAYLTDNVASATKLQTARMIAGISFDGTENINIPFANLSSKPTTISGYGITDAYSKTEVDTALELKLNKSIFDDLFEKVEVSTGVFAIKAKYDFYSTGEVSAYGLGSGGSSGGGISMMQGWTIPAGTEDYYAPANLVVPFYNDVNSRLTSLESGSATSIETTGSGNAITSLTKSGSVITADKGLTFSLSDHLHTGVYETVFTKNNAFNKDFGTTAGTVAQGNDSRIINGQTAYGWGNHASAGYALNSALTAHINKVDNPHSVTKEQVGLGNVLNVASYSKAESDTNLTSAINTIEIGGRNLILNSSSFLLIGTDNSTVSGHTTEVVDGQLIGKVFRKAAGDCYYYLIDYHTRMVEPVKEHTNYVWSIEVRSNCSGRAFFDIRPSYGDYFSTDFESTNDKWVRISGVVEIGILQPTDNWGLALVGVNGTNIDDYVYYRNPKIEKGNKPTDWTPAPEDVDAKIALVQTNLDSHTSLTNNPHSVTKAQVGLGNVDNTSDAGKPISTATQTALDLKAPLANPTFTGSVTAPTFIGALSGNASTATKLSSNRTYALTGDVAGSVSNDLASGFSIATTLANSGVTAGTYRSVTVDAKGRVTDGTNPTTVAGYGLTDAVTTNTVQTITGAKTFSANLTASVSVTTPKVIFNAAGWSLEQVGSELQMKHNNVLKMRFTSTGSIVATEEITAFGSAT